METEKIVIVVVSFLLLAGLNFLLIRIARKQWKNKIYICPATDKQYMPLYRCKLKCPLSGEWFDAIIYQGIEDNKYYVRERKDFLNRFVKLKELKNGNKSKQGVSEAN